MQIGVILKAIAPSSSGPVLVAVKVRMTPDGAHDALLLWDLLGEQSPGARRQAQALTMCVRFAFAL